MPAVLTAADHLHVSPCLLLLDACVVFAWAGLFFHTTHRSAIGLVVHRSHFQVADALATLVLALVFIEEVQFRFSTAAMNHGVRSTFCGEMLEPLF